jgi:hypothetical protein
LTTTKRPSPKEDILGLPRRWWSREVNKPWIEDDKVLIAVRAPTDTPDLANSEYYTPQVLQSSLEKIYDFYGKNLDPQQVTTGNLIEEEIHFYSRPNLRPLLLVGILKVTVEAALRLQAAEYDHGSLTADYHTPTFLKKIRALRTKFEKYQKQYQYFDGRTSPQINFIQEYNRLEEAHRRIVEFVQFNGLQYREAEDDRIRIYFDNNYYILDVVLIQDGMCKRLTKGKIYFLDDTEGLKDLDTNQILYNLSTIYANRNNRKEDNWSDFVENYLVRVEVDFFGRPCTNKASEMLKQEVEETNRLFESEGTLDRQSFLLQTPEIQRDLMNSALQEKSEDLSKKLSKAAEKVRDFNNKTDLINTFLNKWGITNLIEAALECLTIKTGAETGMIPTNIPNVPVLPGLNPYDIAKAGLSFGDLRSKAKPFKLPPMAMKLPTVDISKSITDGIKGALKQAGIDALISLMETIADMIVEICQLGDEEPGSGLPIPSILDQFPSAIKLGEGESPLTGLEACYEEYDIDSMVGNSFLMYVSENLTPREVCDLLNGAPSTYVIQIIENLISTKPDLASLQTIFTNSRQIISFFACIANLVSPAYCANVYDAPRVNVNNLDPCTIEDLLMEDDSLLEDLIDAYNNIDDKIDDLLNKRPDLSCGGGIVPSLADMPAFAHSMGTTMNSIFELPKTTFTTDIAGLKTLMVVPAVSADGSGANARNAAILEELEANRSDADRANDAEERKLSGPDKDFLNNLLPSSLRNQPMVKSITAAADIAIEQEIARLQGMVTYEVSPEYATAMANLDTKLLTPFAGGGAYVSPSGYDLQDLANMYFTLTDDSEDPAPTKTIYFAPGALAGSNGSLPGTFVSAVIGTDVPYAEVQGFQTNRAELEQHFGTAVFGNYFSVMASPIYSLTPNAPTITPQLREQLYVPGYLALFNSLSYNIRKSELFDVSKFNNLILTPVSCPDIPGSAVGKDLLDIQNIIDEALREFADNACSERTCIIGPVEDAIMFASLNAYIQVLLIEQLLKNIFLMDAYGMSDFMSTPLVTDRIIQEIYQSIGSVQDPGIQGTGSAIFQAALTFDMMKDVSVFYVEKHRNRIDQASPLLDPSGAPSRRLPDPMSTDPTAPYITIPDTIVIGDQVVNLTIPTQEELDQAARAFNKDTTEMDLPGFNSTEQGVPQSVTAYRHYALQYMIKRRIVNAIPAVKSVFAKSEPNFNTSLLLNGLPLVDVPSVGNYAIVDGATESDITATDFGTGFENVRAYELYNGRQNIDTEQPVPYDYGYRALTDDRAQHGPSMDEGIHALTHGLFSREKYVKFGLDYAALASLRDEGEVESAVYDFIRGPLRNLIPNRRTNQEVDETRVPAWAPPEVDQSTTMITSVQQFNQFINDVRGGNRADITSALAYELGDWEEFASSGLDALGIEVTYLIARNVDGTRQDMDDDGALLTGIHSARLMRGPLTSNNYDAIRFWINEVQKLTTGTSEIKGLYYPAPGHDPFYYPTPGHPRNWGEVVEQSVQKQPNAAYIHHVAGLPSDFEKEHVFYPLRDKVSHGLPAGKRLGVKKTLADMSLGMAKDEEADPEANRKRYDHFGGRIKVRQYDDDASNWGKTQLYYVPKRKDLYNNLWNMSHYWGFNDHDHLARAMELGVYSGKDISFQLRGEWDLGLITGTEGLVVPSQMTDDLLAAGAYEAPGEHGNDQTPPATFLFDANGNPIWVSDSVAWDQFNNTGFEYVGEEAYPEGVRWANDQVYAIYLSVPDFAKEYIDIPSSEFGVPAEANGDGEVPQVGDDSSGAGFELISDELVTTMYEPPPAVEYSLTTDEQYVTRMKYVDQILNTIISNIRVGNRIIYSTPEMTPASNYGELLDISPFGVSGILNYLKGSDPPNSLSSQDQQFYENKSNFLVKNRDDKYILTVDTGIAGEIKVADSLAELDYSGHRMIRGNYDVLKHLFDRYETLDDPAWFDSPGIDPLLDGTFGEEWLAAGNKSIADQITTDPKFVKIFNEVYDSKNMVSFIFLYGLMTSEGNSTQLSQLFSDTKIAIRTILRAALAGGDYTFEDPEKRTASDVARDNLLNLAESLGSEFAAMGASFILKMLIEAPIRILKALAEMLDPHVAIGKIVKDTSAQVIQIAEQVWDVASPVAQTGVSLGAEAAGTEVPDDLGVVLDMDLVDYMQIGINEAFSGVPEFLRPSVDEKGLNLIGKLPWLIFPPPTPWLGIPYILLNLLEECPWCPSEEQAALLTQQCKDLAIQLETQGATAAPAVVKPPESTIDCAPPEEASGCIDEEDAS